MASDSKDIMKWMDMVDDMLVEESDSSVKANDKISKTNDKLMQVKVEKLNSLIQKMAYEKDEETEEDDVFQFEFQDKEDHFEFKMPLTVLFGRKTQEFAARFWDDLFMKAGIRTSFIDNIQDALAKTGNINLTMKIDKNLEQEYNDDEFEE